MMKTLSLTKLIIKLLISMIIIVMLFMISITLYSIRYWPDVSNYINAKVTITRIPTITELNLTIVDEVNIEYTTTDSYDTTYINDVFDDDDDYFSLDDVENDKHKRSLIDDNNKIPMKDTVDYILWISNINNSIVKPSEDDAQTKSFLDDVEVFPNYVLFPKSMETNNVTNKNISSKVFPWIAAIFIKDKTTEQFNYFCDGALLSEEIVLTAARCIQSTNNSVDANNIIVLLGKTSLVTMGTNEKAAKVKQVHIYEHFNKGYDNDLAILILEDPVKFSENIQPSPLLAEKLDYDVTVTTGWAFSGELTLVNLHNLKREDCDQEYGGSSVICAGYNNDVTVCPSYGGLLAGENNETWYLYGLRDADITDRDVCINKPILYTVLDDFNGWISKFIF